MSEFSSENIQRAAEEVRRGNFGDFMFRDPGQLQQTTRRRTSSRNTSSHHTSSRNTSRHTTSSHNTSRRLTSRVTSKHVTSRRHFTRTQTPVQRRCFTTTQGNAQVERCFEGSNQFYYRSTIG